VSSDVDINLLHIKLAKLEGRVKALEEERQIKKYPIPQWEENLDKPPKWPNESYTDYLKRIGEYNEAQ
jgi:hypothetical protein